METMLLGKLGGGELESKLLLLLLSTGNCSTHLKNLKIIVKKVLFINNLYLFMVLERIFGKSLKDVEEEDEEYIDFNKIIEKPKNVEGKMEIKIEKLLEFRDAEKIQREVREGKIVLAETEELKEKDIGELKRAIERIKKTIIAIDGDIVMGPKSILIVCPGSVVISRRK